VAGSGLEFMYVPIAATPGLLIDYKVALELAAFEHLAFGSDSTFFGSDLAEAFQRHDLGKNFEGRLPGRRLRRHAVRQSHW